MSYVLVTDVAGDLTDEIVKELNINVIPMEFALDEVTYKHYPDCREMSLDNFYNKLKSGSNAKTTQININAYTEYFSNIFKQGKDILYICFTTGLSGSYNSCLIAVNELKDKYPERTIYVVDSACASIGHGNLAYQTALYVNEGHTLEEAKNYAEQIKLTICHWFVVEDLDQLKRGGRISSITASFGKALNIRPLLSVADNGTLTTVAKIRGTLKSFDALVNRLVSQGKNIKNQTVFIGYTYDKENAEKLKRMVAPLVKDVKILDIGPIIGTHVGINMLAISFIGQRIYE